MVSAAFNRVRSALIVAGVALATIVSIGPVADATVRPAREPGEIVTVAPGSLGRQTGAYNPDRDEYLHLSRDRNTISAAIVRADGTIRVPAFTVVNAPGNGADFVYSNGNVDAEYNPSTKEYVVSYVRTAARGSIPFTGRIHAHRIDAVSGALGPAVIVDRVVSGDHRCWADNHDIVYDPATGGYVLAYAVAMLFATTDPCEDSSNDHKTTVARLTADLAPGPRTDLPGDLSNGSGTWTRLARHPDTGQFLVGRLSDDGGRYTLLRPDFTIVREEFADVRNTQPSSFPTYVFVGVEPESGNWVAVTRGSKQSQIMVLAANGTVVTPSAARSTQVHNAIAVFPGGTIVTSEGFRLGEYDLDGTRTGELTNATGPDGSVFRAEGIIPGADGKAMVAGNFQSLATTEAAAWFIDISDPDVVSSAPRRFLETRSGLETFDGEFELGRTIGAGETIKLQVAGRGDVPIGASGVVANVTAVSPSGPGFVTVWDCVGDPPTASSLNYGPGDVVPNELVAKLSPSGELCLFSRSATHLLVDVVGVVPESSLVASLVPRRFLETRPGLETFDGQAELGRTVRAGETVRLQVTGRGGIVEGTSGVIANVTAVSPSGPGFVTVWDCVGDPPTASSLNYGPGDVVPNELVAKLSSSGELCLFSRAATHLLVDVVGTIPADSDLVSSAPRRYLESRPGLETFDGQAQLGRTVRAGEIVRLQITGRGGIASGTLGVVANVTAVSPSGPGFVTVWDCVGDPPTASSLNYGPGDVVPNELIAKLSTSGQLCLFSRAATHLLVDVVGTIR